MNFRILSFSFFLCHNLFYVYLIGSVTSISLLTNETDKEALLSIRDEIKEDPFNIFSSWNHSIHFCDWKGITCGARHQRVTVLNFSSFDLVGSLSPRIGNLTFLKGIILENNKFYGAIPQEIGRLFRLEYLSIYSNDLQGEFPVNLTNCKRMRVIDVYDNGLEGKVPAALSSLPKLVELQLSKNHFMGKIPSSFGNLSALTTLTLSDNNLEGSIPSEFVHLSKLEYLELSTNKLSGTIPSLLYNISSIQYFAFASNRFHGIFPSDLGLKLPNLEAVFVGGNKFSGPIPLSITNASGLTHFDIGMNAFTGPMPMNLGNLKNLQLLNFVGNPLGSNKTNDLSFINSLTNCSSLRILHSNANNYGGVLPNSLGNLSTTLTSLRLDGNFISGSIPEGIGNLFNLENLALNDNMLTASIPDSIGRLTKLQRLYLSKNRISGGIPYSLGNITLITILSMGENLLQGQIPFTLSRCKNLQGLDLSRNQLSGSIPEKVIGLASLSLGVNLSQNRLTGYLPMEVGELINLGRLDISNNKLSGEIPSSIGNCEVLELLNLQRNLLEGTIPSTFKELRGLQFLDISHNHLSGEIPGFVGELSLKNLNLSFNMFEGEVPNKGVFTNASAFSVVGNKNLCGRINMLKLPSCPVKLSKERHGSRRRALILALSISISLIMLSLSVCVILYVIKKSKRKSSSESCSLGNQYPTISYAEILQATNDFNSSNLIGKGRYGTVYRGHLNVGEKPEEVAIKVLNLQQDGAYRSFAAECNALRNIRHRNLVKIITSCSSIDFKGNDFKALVFEFFSNGSLEDWLHPGSPEQGNSKSLNLTQRLNIAIDLATALDYLHNHCEAPVVHCDLKPSNVLLDIDLRAHVCDFGIARMLQSAAGKSNHAESSSIGIRGTVGYIPPEYGAGMKVWAQGDLYSYGILILEMFTGKRPTEIIFTESFSLYSYVRMSLPNQLVDIVDPQLMLLEKDNSNSTSQSGTANISKIKDCLASVIRIGLICSSEQPTDRMEINDVLMELHVIRSAYLKTERKREREIGRGA